MIPAFPIRALRSLTILVCLQCAACAPSKSQLDQILERGELRVVTRNGPTTYFVDREGQTGIEYEMAKALAGELGVRLRIIVAAGIEDILEAVVSGSADIAAAALPQYLVESAGLLAGPSYHWVTDQVVHRYGRRPPASLDDIFPNRLHLTRDAVPPHELERLQNDYPRLTWYIHDDEDSETLLDRVLNGRIAYTVLPSNELAYARQVLPEIRAALTITPPEPLVWAMRKTRDRSLHSAVDRFIQRINKSGELGKLLDHFYGPVESFDYVDSRTFIRRVDERLPRYREMFEAAAAEFNLDWRLLAAISYQESHWDEDARSPTGVRGLMMLTLPTARRVGINDRLDPQQSLRGGAHYLGELDRSIPARIPEPDRTWMTLAAYNVGLGHLEDARVLTQRQGADPDSWLDVRQRLPLLGSKQWYPQTKHGYARGHEPVFFVRRVRRYYSVLVQLTQPEPEQQLVEADLRISRTL